MGKAEGEVSEEKRTCGEYYRTAMTEFRVLTAYDDIWAAAFVCGQAEKVMIHSCEAAMFRPSADRRTFLVDIVDRVALIYGLMWMPIGVTYAGEKTQEIWLCRNGEAERTVQSLRTVEQDSPAWHAIRAGLCGIPSSEVDFAFHQRQGFGKRCD